MATDTQPARIEFHCDKETLKFTHPFPFSLFGTPNPDPNVFISTIKPLLMQHYDACLAVSEPNCCICSAPTTQVILTPMSWLHVASDPFVHTVSAAACGKPGCDTKVRQNMQIMMQEMSKESPSSRKQGGGVIKGEIKPCRVCKTVENTSRCARCKIAFYCSMKHQRMDWPIHKAACKAAVESEDESFQHLVHNV